MAINIKELFNEDVDNIRLDKVNYNFDQILSNGGGPQGVKGEQGISGNPGQKGQKGDDGLKGDEGLKGETGTSALVWHPGNIGIDDGDGNITNLRVLRPYNNSNSFRTRVLLGEDTVLNAAQTSAINDTGVDDGDIALLTLLSPNDTSEVQSQLAFLIDDSSASVFKIKSEYISNTGTTLSINGHAAATGNEYTNINIDTPNSLFLGAGDGDLTMQTQENILMSAGGNLTINTVEATTITGNTLNADFTGGVNVSSGVFTLTSDNAAPNSIGILIKASHTGGSIFLQAEDKFYIGGYNPSTNQVLMSANEYVEIINNPNLYATNGDLVDDRSDGEITIHSNHNLTLKTRYDEDEELYDGNVYIRGRKSVDLRLYNTPNSGNIGSYYPAELIMPAYTSGGPGVSRFRRMDGGNLQIGFKPSDDYAGTGTLFNLAGEIENQVDTVIESKVGGDTKYKIDSTTNTISNDLYFDNADLDFKQTQDLDGVANKASDYTADGMGIHWKEGGAETVMSTFTGNNDSTQTATKVLNAPSHGSDINSRMLKDYYVDRDAGAEARFYNFGWDFDRSNPNVDWSPNIEKYPTSLGMPKYARWEQLPTDSMFSKISYAKVGDLVTFSGLVRGVPSVFRGQPGNTTTNSSTTHETKWHVQNTEGTATANGDGFCIQLGTHERFPYVNDSFQPIMVPVNVFVDPGDGNTLRNDDNFADNANDNYFGLIYPAFNFIHIFRQIHTGSQPRTEVVVPADFVADTELGGYDAIASNHDGNDPAQALKQGVGYIQISFSGSFLTSRASFEQTFRDLTTTADSFSPVGGGKIEGGGDGLTDDMDFVLDDDNNVDISN